MVGESECPLKVYRDQSRLLTSYYSPADGLSITQQSNAFIVVSIKCKYIGLASSTRPYINQPTINQH